MFEDPGRHDEVSPVMRVLLISPYTDVTSVGVRVLSAWLKRAGQRVNIVFMPDRRPLAFGRGRSAPIYGRAALEDLVEMAASADLVGVTVMTNFFDAARQITKAIRKKLAVPVIWGGIHATIRPEECLETADFVCVGEGEEALEELVQRMSAGLPMDAIRNIWLKKDGHIVRNPLRPLIRDLDSIPPPDYDYGDHFAIEGNRIERMDGALMKKNLSLGSNAQAIRRVVYETVTTRGCPHGCAYCCNSNLRHLYPGQKYLRFSSIDRILEELSSVTGEMPFIDFIWFSDDSFFARSEKAIKEFSAGYKKKIRLPFFCLTSPNTLTEPKLASLVDAGLRVVQMGIQTGSSRIQRVFNRATTNKMVLESILIINKYKDQMAPPTYDFILDIPYETTMDKAESLRLISQIPKPYRLNLFSLIFYPETELYKKAYKDGFIHNEVNEIYRKRYAEKEMTYINLLFRLCINGRMPGRLLGALANPALLALFSAPPLGLFFSYFGIGLRRLVHKNARKMRES